MFIRITYWGPRQTPVSNYKKYKKKKKKVQDCLKGVKHQSTLPITHSHPTEKEMVGI